MLVRAFGPCGPTAAGIRQTLAIRNGQLLRSAVAVPRPAVTFRNSLPAPSIVGGLSRSFCSQRRQEPAEDAETEQQLTEGEELGSEFATPYEVREALDEIGPRVIWNPRLLVEDLESHGLKLNSNDLALDFSGTWKAGFVNRLNMAMFWDPMAFMMTLPLGDITIMTSLVFVGSQFSPGLMLPLAHFVQQLVRRFMWPAVFALASVVSRHLPKLQGELLFAEMLGSKSPSKSQFMPEALRRLRDKFVPLLTKYGLLSIILSPMVSVVVTGVFYVMLSYFLEDPLDLFRMLHLEIPESLENIANKYSGIAAAMALFGLFSPITWSVVPYLSMRFLRPVSLRMARVVANAEKKQPR